MSKLRVNPKDFRWTLAAFVAVGLSGFFINQVIATQLGVAVLGRYNMLLAIVIVGGQIGVMGMQGSMLYHTPKARSEGTSTSEVVCSGVLATALTSSITTLVFYVGGEILLRSVGNLYFLDGLRAVTIGLFLFPINKVLLAHINGLQRIPIFSCIFSGRYILLASSAAVVAYNFDSDQLLPWTITMTEGLIFISLVIANRSEIIGLEKWSNKREMVNIHFRYGRRGFLGATLLDLNTRLDIILLGLISGASSVGIYSVASLFADGLYQAAIIFRYNFDPVVTSLFVQDKLEELQGTIARAKRRIYFAAIPVVVLSNVMYHEIVGFLFTDELAEQSWPVFLFLSLRVGLSAGYIPFLNILQQCGFPSKQSMLVVCMTGTNLALNLALIPFFGVRGAAIATAVSGILVIFYLRKLSNSILGFRV